MSEIWGSNLGLTKFDMIANGLPPL